MRPTLIVNPVTDRDFVASAERELSLGAKTVEALEARLRLRYPRAAVHARELSGEPNLTFNPGVIVGGERVTYDTLQLSGTAAGKTNIIAPAVTVEGDLRTLSAGQLDSARARMRAIVARSLPGTSAEIAFADGYPAMSPTPGNYRLLAVYDSASRALGHDSVTAFDPGRRGAGDISFVAPVIDGLDGLGALGNGSHSPNENVDLTTLPMQTERAAIFMYRLSRQKAQRREGAVQ